MILRSYEIEEYDKYTVAYDFSKYFSGKTVLVTGSKGIVGGGIIRWLLFENAKKNNNTHIIASSRNPEKVPDYIEKDDDVVFCKFGEEDKIEEIELEES